jgi:DNA repair exonuclease SbcCD nuclease subunit
MKIALIADLHIHPHGSNSFRLDDCLNAVEQVNDYCSCNGISVLAILGDIFHLRDNVPSISLYKSYQLFEKISKTKKIYAVAGNHDAPFKIFIQGLNNIRHLSSLMETFYDKDYGCVQLGGCTFWFLHCIEEYDKTLNILNKIQEEIINNYSNSFNVLCSHLDIGGFSLESGQESKSRLSISDFKIFDKVFLGHLHSHQTKSNVSYIGSPLQLTFGDRNIEHGFVVFDTETHESKFIPLCCRQFIVHRIDKIDLLSKEELNIMKNFNDNIVKIEINEYLGSEWLITLKKLFEERFKPKQLKIECCSAFTGSSDDLEVKETPIASQESLTNNIEEVIMSWLKSSNISNDKIDAVLQTALNIISGKSDT